jgi:type I restriction enzyme S subunit
MKLWRILKAGDNMTKKMNTIEKLIAGLCPQGVEFKELGKVCEIADNKRKPVKSGLRIPGAIPYYGANNIQDYVEGFTHDGEYVLLAEDGSADLGNYSVQYATGKFWANNHVHVIRGIDEVLNRFLFHWFRHMNFVPFLSGGTRAKLTKARMLEIKIPIPPLAIQQEIVKILDTFTTLEAELEAELEARKKQYEYYRDDLLTFGEDVEWKMLGECIEKNIGGGTPSKAKLGYWNGDIPWASVGDLTVEGNIINTTRNFITAEGLKNSSSHLISKGSVIVAVKISPGKMKIANSDIAINQDLRGLFLSNILNPKFLVYYSQTINIIGNGTIVKGITVDTLNKIPIPIPPLADQKRIVAILDKFDALVNDISVGLPAELNARRKQYEYYRGKLLMFEPLEKEYANQ